MILDQPILIIGAGIGGLTLALGLQCAGFRVVVAERSPQLGEIGAGLTVGPNATRALEFIGLGTALATRGDPSMGSQTGLHYQTGTELYQRLVTTSFREQYGAELYLIHRADLHEALVSAVRGHDPEAIRVAHRFVGLHQSSDSITAEFADGERISGAMLVGCDGVRSVVRASLWGPEAPRFTGYVAFRGLAPATEAAPYLSPTPATFFGPGRSFTRYLIRHGTAVNYVGIAKTDAWQQEGWTDLATHDEASAHFEGWHSDIHALIRATPVGNLTKWALYDRDPLPRWSQGRATLLGDSAHAMLPFLGMGAAMAIEDAVVLARCIEAASDVTDAFQRYEGARLERTSSVLLNSRLQGEIAQRSHPETLRAMDGQGEIRLGLFDYDPVGATI